MGGGAVGDLNGFAFGLGRRFGNSCLVWMRCDIDKGFGDLGPNPEGRIRGDGSGTDCGTSTSTMFIKELLGCGMAGTLRAGRLQGCLATFGTPLYSVMFLWGKERGRGRSLADSAGLRPSERRVLAICL